MRLELVSIKTPTHPLDGLYYEPASGPIIGSVLLFHGNCKNFYSGPSRFVAGPLVEAGFAVLAFNRRGHDVLHTHGRGSSGGAHQLAAEMIEDNALAADWMKARGHAAPVVVGHSNGGMLAVPHVAARPDTPAMVLLSAHRGGPNLVSLISGNGLFARDRVAEITETAKAMVAEGRADELMLLPGWWHVITARTFLDFSTQLPDMMDHAPQVRCPTLFIRGDKERVDIYPAEEFAARSGGPTDVEIRSDCDHFYTGQEREVADRVVSWLKDRGFARG